mmetsp:Transcript_81453/g.143847  ORF Transcript_81453/g.143847 Transcript_81453/m.143847 type:complete len:269 (+) Transcript_81453:65-871(+)
MTQAKGMVLVVKHTFLCLEEVKTPTRRPLSCPPSPLNISPSKVFKALEQRKQSYFGPTLDLFGAKDGDGLCDADTQVGSESHNSNTTEEYAPVSDPTTVMLRNVPVGSTREKLMSILNRAGFAGEYDFLYLPINFKNACNFRYAFINFATPKAADGFRLIFHNSWLLGDNDQASEVSWCKVQGLEENIKRYQNSPVLHESVPDHCKPILLKNGCRVQFPVGAKLQKPPMKGTRAAKKMSTRPDAHQDGGHLDISMKKLLRQIEAKPRR